MEFIFDIGNNRYNIHDSQLQKYLDTTDSMLYQDISEYWNMIFKLDNCSKYNRYKQDFECDDIQSCIDQIFYDSIELYINVASLNPCNEELRDLIDVHSYSFYRIKFIHDKLMSFSSTNSELFLKLLKIYCFCMEIMTELNDHIYEEFV